VFRENYEYSAKDIRFTTKGKTLYAIALGWPADGKFVIQSLAKNDESDANQIKRVELLGYKGKLKFTQTADALTVELPAKKISDLTCSLRITGSNLRPKPIPPVPVVIMPDAQGRLTFSATDAALHGENLKLETRGGKPCIGYWNNGDEWVSWNAENVKPGIYQVSATVGTVFDEAEFVVTAGDGTLADKAPATGSWDTFQTIDLGKIQIRQAGDLTVKVSAKDSSDWKAINLNSIQLTPAN
jgi:alpha-L-fucosidase